MRFGRIGWESTKRNLRHFLHRRQSITLEPELGHALEPAAETFPLADSLLKNATEPQQVDRHRFAVGACQIGRHSLVVAILAQLPSGLPAETAKDLRHCYDK